MRFGFRTYELDEEHFELRCAGKLVPVQPKVLELLLYLIRHRDRVVAKEELLTAVWPDAVVTDSSLARAVSLARRAVGDAGGESEVIATVSRRGYRFQAPVRTLGAAPPSADLANDYVGRASLLARAREVLERALAGRGRILFLAGEAGIGKTRTAELLAGWARESNAEVLAAFGLESRAPTYWAWARILRSLAQANPRALASLSSVQRVHLGRIAAELGDGAAAPAVEGEAARFYLFGAVRDLLQRASRMRPLALVFDDLHAADAETLWLLDHVARDLDGMAIAIIATSREESAGRAPEQARALDRVLHAPCLERWPLVGLHGNDLRDFVLARCGVAPDPGLLDVLARQTDGNPLLLGESLRTLEARGLLADPREPGEWEALLPRGITHLLHTKLGQLSPDAVTALACAAAIGPEIDRALLSRCALDPGGLDAPLGELVEAGLLAFALGGARLRFPHVLLREALYGELVPPGPDRRTLHARIATALEDDSSEESLPARAHHACEAAPLFDPTRAVALARTLAARATALHDSVRAAAWYERALATLELVEGLDRADRAALLVGLGGALVGAASLERARTAYRLALAHARAAGRVDLLAAAALGFAHRPHSTGRGDPEVAELLEEALRSLADDALALRSRVGARLAAELRHAPGGRADELSERAIAEARRCGDPAVLAAVLDDCTFARWSSADPRGWRDLNAEVARVAMEAGDTDLALSGLKGAVTGYLELGDLAGARRTIREFERAAAGVATPQVRWWVALLNAGEALVDADLERAERRVLESLAIAAETEIPEIALEMYAQLLYLRVEQGRGEEVLLAARDQMRSFSDQPAWTAALAYLLAATGRVAEGRAELEPLVARGFADVPRDRGWLPTHVLAAQVVEASGDTATAELLARALAPYTALTVVVGSALYYGPVAYFLGLLAHTTSNWDLALVHFEEALGSARRAGAHAWAARALVASARALAARDAPGDRSRARSLAAEALTHATGKGLVEIAARVRVVEEQLERHAARRGPLPRRIK